MRSFDLSPLYRSTVGFDRMFNLLDSLGGVENSSQTYPPYNIEQIGTDGPGESGRPRPVRQRGRLR